MHRETTPRICHDEGGHLGLEQMLDLMCDQFYWPCMVAQAKEHIDKCCPCFTSKARQPKGLLENIVAMHPLELVHCNYLYLEPEKGPEENVFSGYRPLYLICPSLCNTIPDHPNNSHYGLSKKILSDQRRNFKSQLMANLCKLIGTLKL